MHSDLCVFTDGAGKGWWGGGGGGNQNLLFSSFHGLEFLNLYMYT